jgi:nifR3 family TIM-barrel protein
VTRAPLRIGPVELSSPLLLAPIAGHTDLAFRILCREQGGVGIAYTDLLNSRALLRGAEKSIQLAATAPADAPCGMQLYGNWDDPLPEAACWAVDHGAAVVDINMGCPVDKVAKKNGGSLLLCDAGNTVKLAERIVKAVERHSGGRVPVTAKMRLGWDPEHFVAPQLARDLEQAGIAAVTVHGRWTVQFFSGQADWARIGEVVNAVRAIPVIGNGDVTEPEHVAQLIAASGCHGVMVGRGALRTPWLFRRAAEGLRTGTIGPEPTFNDKLRCIARHVELLERHHGLEHSLHCMRARISWYGKTMGHIRGLKDTIRNSRTFNEMHDVIAHWIRPEGDHYVRAWGRAADPGPLPTDQAEAS